MREMQKSTKMMHKAEVYNVLQDKTDQATFDKQMQVLQDDGEICQAYDANHFCIVE